MLLQKRSNGIYYFRWVYPPALRSLLGKRELIKSLRTTSKSQALARTGAYYMLVEKYRAQLLQLGRVVGANSVIDEYPQGISNCLADIISGSISVEDMDNAFYQEYVSWFYSYFVEGVNCYQANDYSEMISHREMFSNFLVDFQEAATNQKSEVANGVCLKCVLLNFIESVDELDSVYLPLTHFIDMLKQTDSVELIERLSSDLMSIFHQCLTIINNKLESSKIKPSLPSFIAPKTNIALDSQSSTAESQSILFSKLYSQFITFKKAEVNLKDKMQGDYNDYVKTFIFALGDKPIGTITKKQIKQFLLDYEKLPRRNLKAYKSKSIDKLWGVVVPEQDRIATRTMT
ncbi:MAG: DUF3258 domain-containing protein, partial [Sphingobacteriales bacterium]